jgi:hypothetical protein
MTISSAMIKKTPALAIATISVALLYEGSVIGANWAHAADNPLDEPPLEDASLPMVFATSTSSSVVDTIATYDQGPRGFQPVNMITGDEIEPTAPAEIGVEQGPAGPKLIIRFAK